MDPIVLRSLLGKRLTIQTWRHFTNLRNFVSTNRCIRTLLAQVSPHNYHSIAAAVREYPPVLVTKKLLAVLSRSAEQNVAMLPAVDAWVGQLATHEYFLHVVVAVAQELYGLGGSHVVRLWAILLDQLK